MRTKASPGPGAGCGISLSVRFARPKAMSCHAFIDWISLLQFEYSRTVVQSNYRRSRIVLSNARLRRAPIFLPKEPSRRELLLTAVLYALSDDVRLGIVRQLAAKGEQPCGVF